MMMMDWRRNVFENGSYFRKVFDYVRGVNAVNAHLRAASAVPLEGEDFIKHR